MQASLISQENSNMVVFHGINTFITSLYKNDNRKKTFKNFVILFVSKIKTFNIVKFFIH
jgi:hypothetical protein